MPSVSRIPAAATSVSAIATPDPLLRIPASKGDLLSACLATFCSQNRAFHERRERSPSGGGFVIQPFNGNQFPPVRAERIQEARHLSSVVLAVRALAEPCPECNCAVFPTMFSLTGAVQNCVPSMSSAPRDLQGGGNVNRWVNKTRWRPPNPLAQRRMRTPIVNRGIMGYQPEMTSRSY